MGFQGRKEAMAQIIVEGAPRDTRGKNEARRMRGSGRVPATLYGGKGEAISLAVNTKQVTAILRSETGHNTLFQVDLGGKHEPAIVKDWQVDPVSGRLLHVDLLRIARDDRHRDTQKIDVQRAAAHWIDLPILYDGRFVLSAEVHLKQSVVTGFGAKNRGDLFGVDGERNRFPFAAIKSRGNSAAAAHTPRFIFASRIARRAFHNNLSHSFFPSLESHSAKQRLRISNKQLADRSFFVNGTNAARE